MASTYFHFYDGKSSIGMSTFKDFSFIKEELKEFYSKHPNAIPTLGYTYDPIKYCKIDLDISEYLKETL